MTLQISASDYVLLSAQSYFYYRGDGQQPLTVDQVPSLSGWTLDHNYSYTNSETGFSVSVFKKDGQYVVAYRGTDDWREGQGDAEQNTTFASPTIRSLFGFPGLGAQTLNSLEVVQRMVANGKIPGTVYLIDARLRPG